ELSQRHPELVPGPYVRLTVSDTGCGMDRMTLSRVFEPFFTTKPVGKGTGLGLATVYGIVKQSDGFIYVRSELGKGTNFDIYSPPAGDAEPERSQRPSHSNLPGGSEVVLVAEDQDEVRHLAVLILRMAGYTVLEAGAGDEALNLGRRHKGPIHLL